MRTLSLQRARRLLCSLQDHIFETLVKARARYAATFHHAVAVTAADTIYRIDRISEEAVCTWFEEHWPKTCPVELVMEGLPDESVTTFPRGTPLERTQFKCILDPIDGTRGLMYDKRSAWILAGLAPQRGKRTRLSDIHVAVMTELPTSKQQRSDQLSAIRGEGVVATQRPGLIGRRKPLRMQPSGARTFEHGFASFCRFFPEGKKALSAVEEQIWRELELYGKDGGARVFEDQYISSGGQLYELMVGHDRMIADLRPVVFAKLGLGKSAMCCHPYDICTALILEELGGVVETPEGKVLSSPLDTVSSVAWVGYANPILARQMRPVLTRALRAL